MIKNSFKYKSVDVQNHLIFKANPRKFHLITNSEK